MKRTNVTADIKAMLQQEGADIVAIGYLCIQGDGKNICSGCTTACDQSVLLAIPAP